MKSIKLCEYSRPRSFHDDLILQDQASGERSQDQWSSGYIEKLGFAGVYLFFLFLIQNIHCAYSLERPRRGNSNVYPQYMFLANILKISKFFLWKFSIVTADKNLWLL